MTIRQPTYPVDPLFLDRWSPRAFDGSELGEEEVLRLIEAARWAPSAYNAQPWRFLYALRGGDDWPLFLDLLLPFNRDWAERASALLFILSDTHLRDAEGVSRGVSASHSFDAGAAWMSLALQARRAGLHARAMIGFDHARAAELLEVPDDHRIEAAVAIGRIGDPASLPDRLRAREMPSDRTPLARIAIAGRFRADGAS